MSGYTLVQLRNGARSLHALDVGETMHPATGPAAEADALYVRQLRIAERMRECASEEFVVWDVGLGGAANALAAIRATRELEGTLRLVSFDHTLAPLRFALENAVELAYPQGHEPLLKSLLDQGEAREPRERRRVEWKAHVGDFPQLLASSVALPAPHAIFFDPFSPAVNPAMWTALLFAALHARLDPRRPCILATYSRATMVRAALLLAGFFVGAGTASGAKEETTIAANTPELIEAPLNARWLERARRSHRAEPLREDVHRSAPLAETTWQQLRAHPQFQ